MGPHAGTDNSSTHANRYIIPRTPQFVTVLAKAVQLGCSCQERPVSGEPPVSPDGQLSSPGSLRYAILSKVVVDSDGIWRRV